MTEPHPLVALLERTADRVPVGPAPADRLAREAAHSRRARTTTLASAAAVVVIAAGLAGVAGLAPDAPDAVAPPARTDPPVDAAPAGTRLVGLGVAAIAVPERWGVNDAQCGVPQRDTVVIDVTSVDACLVPRPSDVDSVEVKRGGTLVDPNAEVVTVDGERAERRPTTCSQDVGGVRVCTGTLRLPTLGVAFRAESSTDAATVDRLLAQVRVLDGQVGVPGYMATFDAAQERSGERYAALLRREGFVARTVTVDSGLPEGFVVDVSPAPGAVVEYGAHVVVEVSDGR